MSSQLSFSTLLGFSQKDFPNLLSLSREIRKPSYQEWKQFKHPKINEFTTWNHEVQESFQVYNIWSLPGRCKGQIQFHFYWCSCQLVSTIYHHDISVVPSVSSKRLWCISTYHVFKNFSTLHSGFWQLSWMNLTHLSPMPARRELEEGLRESSHKPA